MRKQFLLANGKPVLLSEFAIPEHVQFVVTGTGHYDRSTDTLLLLGRQPVSLPVDRGEFQLDHQ